MRPAGGAIEADFVVCTAGPQTAIRASTVGVYVPADPGRLEIIVTAPMPVMTIKMAVSGNGLYGRQTHGGRLANRGRESESEQVDIDMSAPAKPNTRLIREIGRRLLELFSGGGDIPSRCLRVRWDSESREMRTGRKGSRPDVD